MNKGTGWTGFKFLGFNWPKNIKSLSLIELMISIMVVGIMFLSFFSLETFSYKQVLSADRRTKVQNSLAYCLEHMSKYVQLANGNFNNFPNNLPIKLYPAVTPTGFQVRFDCNSRQTPSDLTDDVWIHYTLVGNKLWVGCKNNLDVDCAGSCSKFAPGEELLSYQIVAGFSNTAPAEISKDPTDPTTKGFYVVVDPLGNYVDVGLVGRYYPAQTPTRLTRLATNPQVAIKTRLTCNSASTN